MASPQANEIPYTTSNEFESLHNATLLIGHFHFTNIIQGSARINASIKKGQLSTHCDSLFSYFFQNSATCIFLKCTMLGENKYK